jgi:signal transduction histidine kinase
VSSAALTGPPRRWGVSRGDAWLAGALAVALVVVAASEIGAPNRPVEAVAFVLAAAGPLPLLWRQAAPLAALAGTGAVVVVSAATDAWVGFIDWPVWIALFTCFEVGRLRVRATAVAVVGLVVAGYLVFDRADPVDDLPGIVVLFLTATAVGELSSRRTRAVAAEARRAAENRQRALAAERLLLQERGQLAAELHDSLGHTVNVMVLQAGVGRRVFDDNPGYAREALAGIETAGRGALAELDRLLRVLHPDGQGTVDPFTPTTTDLEELVDRVRATGRQVELCTDAVELTGSGARAVYRIVQEALTNAVRHTPAGRIRVEVSRTGPGVLLEVTNEGPVDPGAAPGHGLVNMRERARLEGGELEAGPVPGGFRVRAVLPLGAAVGP